MVMKYELYRMKYLENVGLLDILLYEKQRRV